MSIDAQRIYAGSAGGKKYFYGDDGKLYDEAGNEQPEKLAEILRANFPPLPPNRARKKRTKPQLVQPSPPTPDEQNDEKYELVDDDNDPSTPPVRRLRRTRAIAGAITSDILRTAFPELHSAATRYRKVLRRGQVTANKSKTKTKTQGQKERKKANRKRNDKELSLKIDQVSSQVRTNGELLRQQLTALERTTELLEKISNGTKSGAEKSEGAISKLGIAFSSMKNWLLPALGIAGIAATGAAAIYGSHRNIKSVEETRHETNEQKYGPEMADQIDKLSSLNPITHLKDIWDHIPKTGRPRSKDSVLNKDQWAPYTQPNGETPATKEAESRKPNGKTVEIKGENISFEARQILLDARSIKINQGSSSAGMTIGGSVSNGMAGGGSDQSPQNGGGDRSGGGGNPRTGRNSSQISDGSTPVGSVFKSDITSPWSPGGNKGPGQGGVAGGTGAMTLGGRVYNRRGSAADIIRNDVGPAMRFQKLGNGGGINENATGTDNIVGKTSVQDLQNNKPFQAALADFQKSFPQVTSEDIYRTIKGESSFKTNIQPNSSGYAGLFQMNTKDIKAAGYPGDLQQFINEPAHVQLEYWKKTFQSQGFKADTLNNTGLANAAGSPKWQTMPGDTEIYPQGSAAWASNPGWRGPDGRITKDSIVNYYNTRNALSKEEKQVLTDTTTPKKIQNASAKNIKNLTLTSDMLTNAPMANMKALGGIADTADKMEEKNDIMVAKPADEPIKAPLTPYINETNKIGGSGISTDLKDDKKGTWSWKSEPTKAGQPNFGDGAPKVDKIEKSNNPLSKSLGLDDIDRRPIDNIGPTPGEIPDTQDTSGSYHRDSQDMSEETDSPIEKSEGNRSRLNDSNGAKKPKPIRKVDLDKYYPQYPKTTEAGSVVGMTVA
jgi:hypothetical protein